MPAAVVLGAAVIGGVASNQAAKQQAKGVSKGLDQSAALAEQARADVNRLFERSSSSYQNGLKGAMDFYRSAAPKRMTPFLQANQQAQTVIGQGAQQANNAILGLPVDMSFTQQNQVQPDTNYMLGAQLPNYAPPAPVGPQPVMGPAPQQAVKDIVKRIF